MKITHFDPVRPRGSISTSAIHFMIPKTVSAVWADATEVPIPKTESSSTNGLAAKVHQTKKFLPEKNFLMLHYHQKNMLNPLVKSVLKSVHNYGRYLQFCARRVCSFQ